MDPGYGIRAELVKARQREIAMNVERNLRQHVYDQPKRGPSTARRILTAARIFVVERFARS